MVEPLTVGRSKPRSRRLVRLSEMAGIAVRRLRYGRGIAGPLRPRPDEVAFFERLVGRGDLLVFDVGANVGDKTAVFLELGARVVAFEPQPLCLRLIHKRFRDDSRVTIVEEGVADSPGILTMSVCDSAKTISTFAPEWKEGRFNNFRWSEQIEVPVITLDEAIERYGTPVFTKIDVEGFEESVLLGLGKSTGILSFEFVREFADATRRCLDRAVAIGYTEFNLTLGSVPEFLAAEWMTAEEVFALIENSNDELMQGDVYARA